MRRLLGILLLVLALSGCGDTGGSEAGGSETGGPETGSSETSSESPESDTPAGETGQVVEIVSETAAGGRTGGPAVRVDRPAGLTALTRDFRTPSLGEKLRQVVASTTVPEGHGLYGAVIAVGCDVPPSASVEVTDGTVIITPGKVAKPLPECFAPVTSVAIALVDLPPS